MPLSVTEKQHWRDAIARRLDRRIEALQAAHPALFERFRREAHAEALGSLGLTEAHAELEAVREAEKTLARRKLNVQKTLLATVRGVPIEEASDGFRHAYGTNPLLPTEVADAIA